MSLDIPATDTITVARIAVAWNIVMTANYPEKYRGQQGDQTRMALTKAFIETYNLILENERSGGKITAEIAR